MPRLIDQHNGAASAQEIDQYLDALEEPKHTTLAQLRQTILDILPEAEQGIPVGGGRAPPRSAGIHPSGGVCSS